MVRVNQDGSLLASCSNDQVSSGLVIPFFVVVVVVRLNDSFNFPLGLIKYIVVIVTCGCYGKTFNDIRTNENERQETKQVLTERR